MALSATMVWEFRANATAGNLNGGGFNPANAAGNLTDYSQQPGAQYNDIDLAATNGTTSSPSVTASSHSFVTADVGNIIHITAGTNWTVGWYEIKSVAAGAATLDRACSSVDSPSSGTYYVGGAMSLASATSTRTDTNLMAALAQGNTVYVANGTYATSVATMTVPNGTAVLPITWIGYNAQRNDACTGTNRPLFVMTGAGVSFTGGTNNIFMNLRWDGDNTPVVTSGARSKWFNIKAVNLSTTADNVAFSVSSSGVNINDSEFISYRGYAIDMSGSAFMHGCYVHDSKRGIRSFGGVAGILILDCIFADFTLIAIDLQNSLNMGTSFIGNTFYGAENKLGLGLNIASASTGNYVWNNIFYGFTTAITDITGTVTNFGDYNCLNNNTANYSAFRAGAHDVTTAPAFANVKQITGATATTSGSVLTQSGADFSTVTDNVDFCYIKSGTGITAAKYLITTHTTTTLTLSSAPGTSAVADKVFQITTGHNFAVGAAMKNLAYPVAFPAGLTTSYMDLGAAQIQPSSGGGATKTRHLGVRRAGG